VLIWRGNFYKWVTRVSEAPLKEASRRYANHKSGKKYKTNPQKENSAEAQKQARTEILPYEVDPVKAESAKFFNQKWIQAKTNKKYLQLLAKHKQMYEQK
jgi:hypothetical protein